MSETIEVVLERFGSKVALLELYESQIPLNFANISKLSQVITTAKRLGSLVLLSIPAQLRPEGTIMTSLKAGEVVVVPVARSLGVVITDVEALPLESYKAGIVKTGLENLRGLREGTILNAKFSLKQLEEPQRQQS
ncbi:hypothetical protein [Thermofilum pendens]|uniref:Cyclophilin TM1367-like domain-containing protein n=1 Tax=Thermofilum pendens (strain DSM 2475 / Hrk 5) TaxID=368408 RepID=A1RXK9_THEPD|nr:hypothetical protein [Thermofilum pendens]ABL77939.1 hypothetical protein Tpen_0533 [Thermofilum pendens Hrk 5]